MMAENQAVNKVIELCLEAEELWAKHPFNAEIHSEVDMEEHRPCETGSRVIFARRVMNALGFCIKCGGSMPCLECGRGL